MLNQLNGPIPASIGPKMTIHFGKTLMCSRNAHARSQRLGCKYSCSFVAISC
jgi:hypothetical protein